MCFKLHSVVNLRPYSVPGSNSSHFFIANTFHFCAVVFNFADIDFIYSNYSDWYVDPFVNIMTLCDTKHVSGISTIAIHVLILLN